MAKRKGYRKKGFSLLEMLAVVVVIGLLATFGHTAYLSYTERAKTNEAMSLLESYQAAALAYRARYDAFSAYYTLFTDSDTSGLVTGTPSGTSASKSVGLKYVSKITSDTGTTVGGDNYILIGAELQHDSSITAGADFVYIAGVQSSGGTVTWQCGASASKANNVNSSYLPATCQYSLP